MQFYTLRFFLAFSFLVSSLMYGDDFVIDNATTEQNGGNVVDGDDTLKVTTRGSVTTDGIDALLATGANNTFDNQGAITTTGDSSRGVVVEDSSVVTSSGTINTAGQSSTGILGMDNNTITNTGKITTEGEGSRGIFVRENNTVVNSGSVTTLGRVGHGVVLEGSNNNFVNEGSICTFGELARGIFVTENSVVTNSCKVVSQDIFSIQFALSGNTLNLLAPSFIGGEINLGTESVVNVTTGPSHSVLWDFSTGTLDGGLLNIDGSVPSFYNVATQQFATFDPTALATAPDFLADVSAGASYAIESRLFRIRECCQPCFCVTPWVAAYGSRFKYGMNDEVLSRRVNYWSVIGGVDVCLPCDFIAGLIFGYGQGYLDADSRCYKSYENEAEGFVGGAYVRKLWNCFFVDVNLTGGNLCYTDKRFVNNNLAPLGEGAHAKADYGSWWISPEAVIGANIPWCYHITFIPNVRYRYAYQNADGYHEKGAAENAVVQSRDVHVDELKAELLISRQVTVVDLCIKGGFLMRNPLSTSNTQVTLLNETNTFSCYADDHYCGYIGGCIAVCFMPCLQFTFEGEYISGHKMRGGRGVASLAFAF